MSNKPINLNLNGADKRRALNTRLRSFKGVKK
jgi:hypothetical protein